MAPGSRPPLLDHLGAVVDHVEAFSRGGTHDETNFVTACNKCNARKNNTDAAAFRRSRVSPKTATAYDVVAAVR
jgi:5-methylcytosine-specific restriction endonuclease McrA